MLIDILKKNRSYRGFDESYKFSREELEGFVDATRYCAAAANIQPLKYYISYEKEEVESILKLTKWGAALPEIHLPFDGHHPTAFIIICQDTEISDNMNTFQKDIGIAAQTMLLLASEKNLGGLMIGNFNADQVKDLLKLNDNIKPMLVIALGKPDENIVITDIKEDGSTKYYRDDSNVHYVPKRSKEELLLN